MIVANEREVQGDLSFFKGIELLIITIPPKPDKNGNINYDLIIEQLIKKIVFFRIKKVIYTSSTSVYGFQKKTISEKSEKYPLSDAAKKIIICENKLIENPYFESCIIRLGGLIGPNRHPIFKLSGKKYSKSKVTHKSYSPKRCCRHYPLSVRKLEWKRNF